MRRNDPAGIDTARGGKGMAVNRIRNKIRSRQGMSLGEVLVTLLILLLSTSVLVTTVSLGVRHYIASLSGSEANMLSSTLQSLMTDELAYTSEIHVDASGNVQSFQSQKYNIDSSLTMFYPSGENGQLLIGPPDGPGEKLLAGKSYPHGLKVKDFSITYSYDPDASDPDDDANYTFTIEFEIANSGNSLSQTFQVININHTVPVVDP